MKTLAIMQARMTSTRLPGKILKEVIGRPLIMYEIERLKRVPEIDELVVATTTNATDDPVEELCEKNGIGVFRGDEDDVLDRYYQCALHFGATHGDVIARFTADCPLIDTGVASEVFKKYFSAKKCGELIDYLCMDHATLPRGVDTEVFSFDVLEQTWRDGHDPMDREHVTWYMWHSPEIFALETYHHPKPYGGYRITVDTPEDFELIKYVIEALYPTKPDFTLDDVISFLDAHQEVKHLNDGVKQKHYD